MGVRRVDYADSTGIQRRVLVPEGEDPSEGIPLSLPIDELFDFMPLAFRRRLTEALWAQGIIEPEDYLRPGAVDKIRAALLSVVKFDVLDIQTYARRFSNGK